MRNTPKPPPESADGSPTHAVHLLAEAPAAHRGAHPASGADLAAARTSAHVRGLAAGLVARGLRVTVSGAEPASGGTAASASTPAGDGGTDLVSGVAARTPGRSAPGRQAGTALRALGADVVHAHGLWAGLLAVRALGRRRQVPLVVSWYTREYATDAVWRTLVPVLERRVARAASVLLGANPGLVDLARRRGARDARLAPTPPPAAEPDHGPYGQETRAQGPHAHGPYAWRESGPCDLTTEASGATGRTGAAGGDREVVSRSVEESVAQVLSVYDEVLCGAR